ncbi:MAG: HigA family addiction module antidote protein [Clostridiales bacterium]|jgi:addiction module HigA family antidote|nr:HigA family addiction module antidote protein [Clostridiales bacterium]
MENKYIPNYAVHPGVVLADDLKLAKITQKELAVKTGIPKTIINEIIKGKRGINAKIAVLFERVFAYEASYWLRLQSFYEETLARLELEKGIDAPYRQVAKPDEVAILCSFRQESYKAYCEAFVLAS